MIRAERWKPADGLGLEPNAIKAATETARNLALTAGPGAGKTEMLAQRADFLLRTGACRYPRRILAISFKVDASRNLRDRVRRRCGPNLAARFDSYTFHAFAKRIIDRFRPVLTGRDALDPDYSVGEARVGRNSITFADMVPLATSIVETSALARNAIRQTYSHVFLDEFQDCTNAQYRFIKACFLGTDINLVAVGDVKQSIMGWADAMDGIFEAYAQDFDPIVLHLYQNFRSAPRLRRMQNALVRAMDPAAAVDDKELAGDDGEIEVLRFADDAEEASELAIKVKGWIDNDHIDPSDIAILVSRQEKLYCEKLHTALEKAGVPYRVEDNSQNDAAEPAAHLLTDFLLVAGGSQQPEAYKRLLDLVVYGHDIDDEEEYRARARWNRYLDGTRSRIKAGTLKLDRREELTKLGEELVAALGRETVVSLSAEYEQGDRLNKLIEQTLDRIHHQLGIEPDLEGALATLSADRAVRIMSVHKSKGLEFATVVVMGIENETFFGEIDAERRLFFVAISRAKHRLVLTVCEHRDRPDGAKRWYEDRTEHEEFVGYAAAV